MQKRLPVLSILVALAALYLAERVLVDMPRYAALVVGGVALVVSLVTAALRFTKSTGDARRAYAMVLVHYAIAAVAVLLYFAQTRDLALVPVGKAQVVVQVLWPALLLLALAPAIAMERAIASTESAGVVELFRVNAGARAARIVVLAVIAFAGINYAANIWNRKVDLSYFKTTEPSEATITLVKSLTTPVEIVLFYPVGNEVLEQLQNYTDALARSSDHVTVRVADQALDVDLAKELKVRNNGVLFVRANGHDEQLKTELDIDDARSTLRTLDSEIQTRIIKAVRPARVAYFTSGHGERDYSSQTTDGRAPLTDFKTLLDAQGFTTRRLGLAEGLGTEVPNDATLVIVAGPTQPLIASEVAALRNYLAHGGRLLAMIDPDDAAIAQPLADVLGVKLGTAPIAAQRNFVRLPDRGESPYYWASNAVQNHASVATLSKASGRAPLVFIAAGSVAKKDDAPAGLTISPTLRTMSEAWEDVNKNNTFDEGVEKRATFDVAVAVEGHVTVANAKEDTPPSEAKPGAPARAVVVADCDTVATGILSGVDGNAIFYVDALRWLAGDDQVTGTTVSEKDVPIVHRKEKDTIWFYGTSFLVPAAVLGIGLRLSKRARRSKRAVKE